MRRLEDIVQTALLRLYRAWHRAAQADSVDAYARQAVLRVFLDQRRRFWHRETPVETTPTVAYDDTGTDDRVGAAGGTRADTGPPACRDRPAALGGPVGARGRRCSEGTVKSQTARGLVALREHLARAG